MSETLNNVEQILTEDELLKLLGISRSVLDDLRYKNGFPFCRLSQRNRIYLVKDVLEFIASRRTVLNRAAVESDSYD